IRNTVVADPGCRGRKAWPTSRHIAPRTRRRERPCRRSGRRSGRSERNAGAPKRPATAPRGCRRAAEGVLPRPAGQAVTTDQNPTPEPRSLRTERLVLRPFRPEDVGPIARYATDEDYRRYLSPTHPGPEQFVAHNVDVDWSVERSWVICLDGKVAGSAFLGINGEDDAAELACLVAPEFWRRRDRVRGVQRRDRARVRGAGFVEGRRARRQPARGVDPPDAEARNVLPRCGALSRGPTARRNRRRGHIRD